MARRADHALAPRARLALIADGLAIAGRTAFADVVLSFRRVHLWRTLGLSDFSIGYRRIALGPAWEIVNTTFLIVALGVVFSMLLGRSDENYWPYLGAGLVIWSYLSSMLVGSASVFTGKRVQILSVNNPLYAYVLRRVCVEVTRLALRAVVLAAVLLLLPPPAAPNLLLAAAGAMALLVTSLWVIPLVGIVSARSPTAQHVLGSTMRFLFLVTPVFWRADALATRGYLARVNPLASALDIVRAPLIGEPMWDHAWTMVILLNAVGLPIALLVFGHFRRSLATWL